MEIVIIYASSDLVLYKEVKCEAIFLPHQRYITLVDHNIQYPISNIQYPSMGLSGKLVSQIDIKCDGDVFHEIFRERPHHISGMTPHNIQNCDLHEGQWGTVGSVIYWNYTHDGKEKVAKEIIEAIDEEKKSVTFKVIEGDLMELYKTFKLTVHVDTNGDDNLVTWTLEYEKLSEDVPDPHTLMEFCLNVTKDIEKHHVPHLHN
ncbi:UNVERIFIED_CONTAM: Kirola, partial [Sesamum indicum]